MMFIYRPQTPSSRGINANAGARSPSPARRVYHNYDPDEAFVEFKRREYIAALEEAEQRAQFQRELAAEEERHRRALSHIAAQEAIRRQHAEALMQRYAEESQQVDEIRQIRHAQRALQERQAQAQAQAQAQGQVQSQQAAEAEPAQAHPHPHAQRRLRPNQPTPQEILRRRLERQKEEERRSREFHNRILSDIFGVPVEIQESHTPVQRPKDLPKEAQPQQQQQQQQQAYEPEQPEKDDEPHWSQAPLRNRALAEIAAINRAFLGLKSTFVFPSGQLERVADSPAPKLAYNPTNATIHAYEHALSDLLSKLDGIDSHGFKGVRMARKQLVVKIEEELLALEKKIAENIAPAAGAAAAAPAAAPSAPAAKDVEMEEAPSHTPNPGGYDVEVEDVFVAPTPNTGTATTTEKETTPLVIAPEVPSQEPAASTETEQTTDQTNEQTNTSAAPVAAAPAPATPTAVPAKHLPTISVSDEEDEVDDAVHVITEEDGTKAKASQEEAYELL